MSTFAGRALVGIVASASLAVSAVACTSGAGPGPPGSPGPSGTISPLSPSPTPTTTGPVTLRFGISGERVLRTAYAKLARIYTNEFPLVTVEVVPLRGDAALTEEVRAKAPDVFVATNEDVPALVEQRLVQPVDRLLEERGVTFGDRYQRLGLEAFSADEALQCMPYDVSPLVVFYNPGLVPFGRLVEPGDERPTPMTGWTWEQFGRAARLMTRAGTTGTYVAPRLDVLLALVRSAGADLVDNPREATTLTLADGATRAALEEILAVARDPRATPTGEELKASGAVKRFAQQRLGMIVGTRALVPELRRWADFEFDVFPLPRLARTRSVADVTGYCISASSDHVDAATDFLTFATGERGSAVLAETGAVVPAHLPTLNSLAFTQPGEAPASVLVFDEAVERSGVVPFDPQWPELREAVEPQLAVMFDDPVIDLEQLLPRIDEQSARILDPEEIRERR